MGLSKIMPIQWLAYATIDVAIDAPNNTSFYFAFELPEIEFKQ
jgi:hypothetical protein